MSALSLLAPNIAGYITPDIEGINMMITTLDGLFDLSFYTKWGVEPVAQQSPVTGKDGQKTATQIVFDEQPKIEALNKYSDAAEQMEKFITNLLGSFKFNKTYKGADVNYGRRYIIESPDKLLEKLLLLSKSGASSELLRQAAEDYYHAEYQNDGVLLNLYLKLLDVEPLPFTPLSAAKAILPPLEYAMKLYYDFWRAENPNVVIMSKSAQALRESLRAYADGKMGADGMVLDTQTMATQKQNEQSKTKIAA